MMESTVGNVARAVVECQVPLVACGQVVVLLEDVLEQMRYLPMEELVLKLTSCLNCLP